MDGLGEALKAFVTRETLLVFLLLIVPGTISLRLYDRIRARQSRNITESFFDIVIVSFINDAFWAYLTNAIVHAYQTRFFPSWWIAFQFVLAIMISPCLLTVIYVITGCGISRRNRRQIKVCEGLSPVFGRFWSVRLIRRALFSTFAHTNSVVMRRLS